MKTEEKLAQRVTELAEKIRDLQREYVGARTAYLACRAEKIRRGEGVSHESPLVGQDWQDQLRRERVLRSNAEIDRAASTVTPLP